jgi:DNA-binding beta-propeller fold protein YncE
VQVPYAFPDINIRERVTLTVAGETRALALTPDGHRAVVTHIAGSHPYVSIIDLTTRTFEAQNIPTNGGTPNGIAITPNGALALVTGFSMFGTSTQVNFVDLRAHVTEPVSVPIPSAISVAVTHDGARALVGELAAFKASLIDIARRALDAQIDLQQMGTVALAITPDDRLGIAVSAFGTVRFIDLTTRTAEPGTLKVGKRPGAIAVTPDGRLALVADVDLGLITVIDVATRSAEPRTIAIPPVFDMAAQSIAITQDGRYALVAGRAGVLTVVDIARRTALPDVIRATPSSGIAMSRDGRTVVMIGHWSSVVTVM